MDEFLKNMKINILFYLLIPDKAKVFLDQDQHLQFELIKKHQDNHHNSLKKIKRIIIIGILSHWIKPEQAHLSSSRP